MANEYYTYLDFYMHTKAVTYVLIIASLIGIALFWNFLAGKNTDDDEQDS